MEEKFNINALFGINPYLDNQKDFIDKNIDLSGDVEYFETELNKKLTFGENNLIISKNIIELEKISYENDNKITLNTKFVNYCPGVDEELFANYDIIEDKLNNIQSISLNGQPLKYDNFEDKINTLEQLYNQDFKIKINYKTIELKPYIFKSKIKLLDNALDANQLFEDINTAINDLKKELNSDYLGRRHPLQTILNRTSGNYIAPTSMKSFDQSPGDYLYDMLTREEKGTATYNGTSWHDIMDKFYQLNGPERTEENLWKLTEEQIVLDQHDKENADLIRLFTKGYIEAPDYLEPDKTTMEVAPDLIVNTEFFAKPAYDEKADEDYSITPLGVKINIPGGVESTKEQYSVPIYNLIDRVDIRDGKTYIIDYKTGAPGDPRDYIIGENGYLPQMIYYKWSIEALYGQPVAGVYICVPAAYSLDKKFVEMDVNSLVQQSKVVDKSIDHLKSVNEIKKNKIFPIKKMMYRSKLSQWYDLSQWNNTVKLDGAPDEIEIIINVRREIYK